MSLSKPQDRDIFHALLRLVQKSGKPPESLGKLLISVGSYFLNAPYAVDTLEAGQGERLVINLRQLDCFTFLENTVVLSRLIRDGRTAWTDFTQALQSSRYRQGVLDGYASRLHYFTDWLYENQRQGVLQDITSSLGGEPYRPKFNFMTAHRDRYPPLHAPDAYRRMLIVEETCSARSYHHLPRELLRPASRRIKDGDLLALTTDIKGLDVVHVGFAIHLPRGIHLLHASQQAGKVIISRETLHGYLRKKKSRLGVIVARVL